MFLHRVSVAQWSEHWNGNPRTRVRVPVGMHVFHISSIEKVTDSHHVLTLMKISVIRQIGAPSPSRIAQNNNSCPNLRRKVTKTNQFAPPRTSFDCKSLRYSTQMRVAICNQLISLGCHDDGRLITCQNSVSCDQKIHSYKAVKLKTD